MHNNKPLPATGLLLFFLIALSCTSCKELGKQPPVTESIHLSPDGQTLLRMYSVLNVTLYERKGGSTFRSGNVTRYFEKIDPQTGNALSESGKYKENLMVLFISNKLIWYKKYNQDSKNFDVAALYIKDYSPAFTAKQLEQNNNGLRFTPHRAYRLKNNPAQVVLRGNDERYYSMDETTGKGLLTVQDSVEAGNAEFLDNSWEIKPYRYSFSGSGRRYLERRKGSDILRTQEDFINPSAWGKKIDRKFVPTTVNSNWLVFSKTTNDQTGVWQINAVDTTTLQTNWYTTMHVDKVNKKQGIESVTLIKEGLLIICEKAVGLLDVNKGAWIWSRAYPDIEN